MSDQNFNLHMISMKNERKHVLVNLGQNYQTKCQRKFRRKKIYFGLIQFIKVKNSIHITIQDYFIS